MYLVIILRYFTNFSHVKKKFELFLIIRNQIEDHTSDLFYRMKKVHITDIILLS